MIHFNNIQIKYNDFIAIHDLNLEIRKGEFFTLLGPSGCGKTTTLRSLVGFAQPSKGSIVVDDQDITHVPIEKRQIGMVFQSYALFPTMSVYENIAFGLKVKKESKENIEKRVQELAEIVDLTQEQLHKNVSELSGGQQQRVAIARALALKPKILVLDEPLSNLDAKLRKQLRKELKKLQKEFGITSIYVTHDQEEALTLSDRIAVFNHGYVEQVGTPEEIYNQSKTEFVCNFIGDSNHLSKTIIEEVIRQTGAELDSNLKSYIRTEKVKTVISNDEKHLAKLKGKVIGKEFYGTFIQYRVRVIDSEIIYFEKNDGSIVYQNGDDLTLYINHNNILQYEEDK
ncbi:ABC transporter ATP-binding protein [Bacillus sp. FJAT-50079]|uniref:ABC transporter ATP-binding protein n=1 Tax=Bacillus sp. FJAT-50079 TaxID=2833577 RepID=UPI001BC8CEA3|nr:ABC transporter ATP-binding protein [Bacillus sp. FJAT-50079]MBS4208407.1 ABC transporter ATP-binding protein [Bacillus sp. FJAT-50079]